MPEISTWAAAKTRQAWLRTKAAPSGRTRRTRSRSRARAAGRKRRVRQTPVHVRGGPPPPTLASRRPGAVRCLRAGAASRVALARNQRGSHVIPRAGTQVRARRRAGPEVRRPSDQGAFARLPCMGIAAWACCSCSSPPPARAFSPAQRKCGAARWRGKEDCHRSAGAARCAACARDCADAHARTRARHGGHGYGRAAESTSRQGHSLADV